MPTPGSSDDGYYRPPPLSQIELHCTDLIVAKHFYCGCLGFRLIGELDDAILIEAGNAALLITRMATPQHGSTLYFNANDRIHELANSLAIRGVYFTQPPRRIVQNDRGMDIWIALFKDPWGNPLALLANMPTRD